jgi:hypothetical protein
MLLFGVTAETDLTVIASFVNLANLVLVAYLTRVLKKMEGQLCPEEEHPRPLARRRPRKPRRKRK